MKYTRRLPSELLGLRARGVSESVCWDFDSAVIEFCEWFEALAHERVIGPLGPQPGRGQTWVPKYPTTEAILRRWGAGGADDPAAEVAALVNDPGFAAALDEIAAALAGVGDAPGAPDGPESDDPGPT